jgi:hypothetical protein
MIVQTDARKLEVGAVCDNTGCTDLCGGCRVTGIPTATVPSPIKSFCGGPGGSFFKKRPLVAEGRIAGVLTFFFILKTKSVIIP